MVESSHTLEENHVPRGESVSTHKTYYMMQTLSICSSTQSNNQSAIHYICTAHPVLTFPVLV